MPERNNTNSNGLGKAADVPSEAPQPPALSRERAVKLATAAYRLNALQTVFSALRPALAWPSTSAEEQDAACDLIAAHWGTLKGGHDAETWRRVELMAAVDVAAKPLPANTMNAVEVDIMLACLPPDLVEGTVPYCWILPKLVAEWQKPARKRGRKPKGVERAPDKWDLLAWFWYGITGVPTTPDSWKTLAGAVGGNLTESESGN